MYFEKLLESNDSLSTATEDRIGDREEASLFADVRAKLSKSRIYLIQSLGDKPLRTVVGEKKDPFRMYSKLKERNATFISPTRVQLQTELYHSKYNDMYTMSEYINNLETLFDRLKGMGSAFSASMQVATLLTSFGATADSPYRSAITALQTMKDEELTWDKATARLLQEYSTRQSQSGGEKHVVLPQARMESALNMRVKGRCYYCRKKRHYKRECRIPKKDGQDGPALHPKVKWHIESQKSMLVHTRGQKRKTIVIDSGASSHMVKDKELFSALRRCQICNVTMADGSNMVAQQMGTAFISNASRPNRTRPLERKNALYIPKLESNVLSVPTLGADGYGIHSGKSCVLYLMMEMKYVKVC